MHRWTTTALVAIAVAAVAAAARSRASPPWFVVFFRPFSIDSMQDANSRVSREIPMADTFQLHPSFRWRRDGVGASMRALVRAVADEHALALHAAGKAASPRQSLAELRALYLPADPPPQADEGAAQPTQSAR